MASLNENLLEMERTREAYWLSHPGTSPVKLRWRALTVRHCFHVLPGEAILEIGAGSGLWTQQLAGVLLLVAPVLWRRDRWAEWAFRRLYLCSVLLFCVIFNHQSESPTFVIASRDTTGTRLWASA